MDFFNFLYKLSNIFTNKRRLKFFIVVGLIILLIFATNRGVFAASGTAQDEETIMLIQLNLQQNLVQTLLNMKNNPTPGFDLNAYNQIVYALAYFQVYVSVPTGDADTNFWVYFYNPASNGNNPNMFNVEGTFSTGLNSGIQIDCMLGNITAQRFARIRVPFQDRQTPIFSNSVTSVYMPSSCYYVRSTYINDFLLTEGYNSSFSPTYSTNDSELQAITNAGFSSVNNNIQQQTNTITNSIATTNNELSEANDNLNSINDEVSATNDFLNDTSVDDSIVSLPTENNQDFTSGFFSGLLNTFYDNFNRGGIQAIQITIPFTNKKFNVNSAYIKTMVENNEKFSTLVVIVQDFWWFALGYYVMMDIYKKINAIKSGDITNIENENISTTLL